MNVRSVRSAACVLFAAALYASAADWPRFRGPDGDGTTAETNLPLTWSEQENLLWRTPLPGPGASSPVVSGSRVFLTCYSGYGLTTNEPGDIARLTRHAVCLDRAGGQLLWSHAVKATLPNKPFQGQYITTHGYASSSAVTDGRSVFFFFANEGVFAFSVEGKPLWQVSVGQKAHDWGNGTSPILHGNLLIVNAAIESDTLLALDKATGKTVWSVRGGFPNSWNTPALVKAPNGRAELVVSTSGKLRAFDPATGRELWFCRSIRADELCPSPVAHAGVVYVIGSPAGLGIAVRAGGEGDVSATHIVWEIKKGSNVSSPVYHDGHLYFVNDARGAACCVKAATGEVVYEQPLGQRRDRYYASPILSGGRLYYVGRASGTVVLAAKPQFERLAQNVFADDPSVANASPAVADGRIFLRSDRYAYCIGRRR